MILKKSFELMRFKSRITERLKNSIQLEKVIRYSTDLCFAADQKTVIPTLISTLPSTVIPHKSNKHTLDEITAPYIWNW